MLNEHSVMFVSPRKTVNVDFNGDRRQKKRTSYSIPAERIIGSLESIGYNISFIDAAADDYNNEVEQKNGVIVYGMSDDDILYEIKRLSAKYILITSMFAFEQFLVDQLVNYIKKNIPECIIILGGIHASIKPQWHFEDSLCDYVVIGPGEYSIILFFQAFKKCKDVSSIYGVISREKYQREGIQNIKINTAEGVLYKNTIPKILYRSDGSIRYIDSQSSKSDIYRNNNYKNLDVASIAIYQNMGCTVGCKYCSSQSHEGKNISSIAANKMYKYYCYAREEYNIKVFHNQSDCFGMDFESIVFLKEVAKYNEKFGNNNVVINNPNAFFLNFFFTSQKSIDIEKIILLKKAGFNVITVAIETFNQEYNEKVNWGIYNVNDLKILFAFIKSLGIKIDVYMMYGFPGQTESQFYNDLNKISQIISKVDMVSWYYCVLIPGSIYYKKIISHDLGKENTYRKAIKNGYNFFNCKSEMNYSKVSLTTMFKELAGFEHAWS